MIVGLTGGIGAGKSLVAQYFAELGARVVDADQLARVAIERGSTGFDQVILRFGESILRDGDIDRQALAAIVFKDQKAKKDLEEIIHPRVRDLFLEVVADLAIDEVLIYEIPLLVESNAVDKFNIVITVEADLEVRRERGYKSEACCWQKLSAGLPRRLAQLNELQSPTMSLPTMGMKILCCVR